MYINKAILYGNLTRDPELKSLPSGIAVCQFSVATNRVWKDKNGVRQESTDYHNVVVFGRQAETVNQYLKKGAGAYVEGRIQTRSWDDKGSGEKKYRTEIVADRIQFGPKSGGASYGANATAPAADTPKGKAAPKEDLATIEYPDEDINPEDIPF
jgi:single-strand DNA-binding protein